MIYVLAIGWLVFLGLAFVAICLRWSLGVNLLEDVTGPHWLATLTSFLLMLAAIFLFPGFHRDLNSRYPFWPYRLIGSIGLFCVATVVYFKYVGRIQFKRKRRRKRAQRAPASPMRNIQK